MLERFDIVVNFESQDEIYSQHFPGIPTVPGALILSTCLNICREKWADIKIINVKKISFLKFIMPDNDYIVTLTKTKGVINFVIIKDGLTVCQSEILWI